MLRIIFLSVFLIIAISVQETQCDAGQQWGNQDQGNQQQGNQNQQNNQNGDQNDKKDPKYYCDGFELACPFKKIRLVLHKIRTAVTPSNEFHLPEFKLHNPFGDNNSGDNKNKNDNKDNNNKQNGDSQNQGSSDFNPPAFNPPAFNPPDFQMHNPFGNNQQNGNS